MSVREVVVWPDPRLRQPSVAVTEFGPALRALYQDLVDTMYAERGLGIAALQLGDRPGCSSSSPSWPAAPRKTRRSRS